MHRQGIFFRPYKSRGPHNFRSNTNSWVQVKSQQLTKMVMMYRNHPVNVNVLSVFVTRHQLMGVNSPTLTEILLFINLAKHFIISDIRHISALLTTRSTIGGIKLNQRETWVVSGCSRGVGVGGGEVAAEVANCIYTVGLGTKATSIIIKILLSWSSVDHTVKI